MNMNQYRALENQIYEQMTREMMPYIIIGCILSIFWFSALIDVIKSDFKNPNNKLIWLILLIFLAPVGTIIYFIIGKSQKENYGQQDELEPDRRSIITLSKDKYEKNRKSQTEEKWF